MMAVTSIWPVKSRVDKVIEYARNPEKTTAAFYDQTASLHQIDGVLEYAADDMKTEKREYVSGINCSEYYAAKQFMDTKLHWDKTDGRLCYHGYQSFKEGEVDAKTAHDIGVELARRLWGDRFEVLVATHCNTGHYHNHFVIDSVSFLDGYKFYNSHEDYRRMREESDRLCREFKISVIENPNGRGKNYGEWQADRNGNPTKRGMIRADIDRAILASTTERGFVKVMTEMGYEFKTRGENGERLKYPSLKPPGAKGFFRFHKLGEGYSLEEIIERIVKNIHKKNPFPEEDEKPVKRYRYFGKLKNTPKITGLRALYFRYCCELHIIVKHPTSVKRVHFLLREDIAKMDKLIDETRFLGKTKIRTISELTDYRSQAEDKISTLIAERNELRNKLKRMARQGDENAVVQIKTRSTEISAELKTLRKEVSLCDGIEQRSGQIKKNLIWIQNEKQFERKEKSDRQSIPHEQARSRSL